MRLQSDGTTPLEIGQGPAIGHVLEILVVDDHFVLMGAERGTQAEGLGDDCVCLYNRGGRFVRRIGKRGDKPVFSFNKLIGWGLQTQSEERISTIRITCDARLWGIRPFATTWLRQVRAPPDVARTWCSVRKGGDISRVMEFSLLYD